MLPPKCKKKKKTPFFFIQILNCVKIVIKTKNRQNMQKYALDKICCRLNTNDAERIKFRLLAYQKQKKKTKCVYTNPGPKQFVKFNLPIPEQNIIIVTKTVA